MNKRIKVDTAFADRIRALLRKELDNGWSCARVASEMQELGQTGWKENIVNSFAKGHRQILQIDEGVCLLAVFGSHAQWVTQEVDRLTRQLSAAAERRSSPRREGMSE